MRPRPGRANREMRGRTDARTLMHGAMLLSALVSMAYCGHAGTDCEDCEATLYQERAAWQLERARLESELKALRERRDSKSVARLVASTLTAYAHTGDGAADRPVTSHLGNTSAVARPSRKLQQAEVAEPPCSPTGRGACSAIQPCGRSDGDV